ncbi:hypothetical protein IGI04_002292 [Brassica rapa subsp. trilocularis]|uniref:Uncharacterized protein n=1 Tax=Brassica rapa subsp. trilocularis TaxID=1813537 RepID=A0ABQ7NV70_BRACM|nr:hypothetical protein IGI04_002292 [Brassica rapa subsp. trilocularis]
MGDVGQDQAAINAQLLANNEELRASLKSITAELAQLRQGGRPNRPRPPGRNQPDPQDTDSDADSTDDTRSQDEDRPNRGGRRNARGHRAQELADLKLEDTSEPLEVPDSFHSSQFSSID